MSIASEFIDQLLKGPLRNISPSRDLTNPNEGDLILQTASAIIIFLQREQEVSIESLKKSIFGRVDSLPAVLLQAVILADSKLKLFELPDVKLSVVVPLLGDYERVKTAADAPGVGQDCIVQKAKQLDWLVEGLPNHTWEMLCVDEACPDREIVQERIKQAGLGGKVRLLSLDEQVHGNHPCGLAIIDRISAIGSSRHGASVLLGLWTVCKEALSEKGNSISNHYVLYTEANLSIDVAQAGLLVGAMALEGTAFATGARYGYLHCYGVSVDGTVVGHPDNHRQRPHSATLALQHFVRAALLPPMEGVYDPQCVFKCFRVDKDFQGILRRVDNVKRGFDLNLLLNALQQYGRQALGIRPIMYSEVTVADDADPDAIYAAQLGQLHDLVVLHERWAADEVKADPDAAKLVEFIQTALVDWVVYKKVITGLEGASAHLDLDSHFSLEELYGYLHARELYTIPEMVEIFPDLRIPHSHFFRVFLFLGLLAMTICSRQLADTDQGVFNYGDQVVLANNLVDSQSGVRLWKFFSALGHILVIMGPFLYTMCSPRYAMLYSWLVIGDLIFLSFMKAGFASPRPYWEDPTVVTNECSGEYGMPNAYNGVCVWLPLIAWFTKVAQDTFQGLNNPRAFTYFQIVMWVGYLALVTVINVAQIKLGTSYPHQVVWGISFSVVWVCVAMLLVRAVYPCVSLISHVRPWKQALFFSGTLAILTLFSTLLYLGNENTDALDIWVVNHEVQCGTVGTPGRAPGRRTQHFATLFWIAVLWAVSMAWVVSEAVNVKPWGYAILLRCGNFIIAAGIVIGITVVFRIIIPNDANFFVQAFVREIGSSLLILPALLVVYVLAYLYKLCGCFNDFLHSDRRALKRAKTEPAAPVSVREGNRAFVRALVEQQLKPAQGSGPKQAVASPTSVSVQVEQSERNITV